MHSDTLLWRPPGRMWEVHTAPSSSPVHDSVEVHCALTGCEIETLIPCGSPKEWAGAHLLAHARAAGAPNAGAFCRCRAQSCRHHDLSLLCHGPVQLALLSTPDGWEAIEACSACIDANEGAEAIASSRPLLHQVHDPAPARGDGTPPRILTNRQGASARQVFRYLADTFPDVSPDARFFALFLVLRTARTGVTAFGAGDINALRLENPGAALDECLDSGWATFSVAEVLSAPQKSPAVVRVIRPTELRGELPLAEKDRARISGWATKGKSFRGLRRGSSAVKLAALCLAAHADTGGRFRVEVREAARVCAVGVADMAAVCDALLAGGWATELRTGAGRVEKLEGRLGRYAMHFVPGDAPDGA